MYKRLSLDKREFLREQALFHEQKMSNLEELRPHFGKLWPAGSPGSVVSIGDYMYQNNGDMPPEEPWFEEWVNYDTLKSIWNYFNGYATVADYNEYIGFMIKHANLYDFSNYHRTYRKFKRASAKKISKLVKKRLAELVSDYHGKLQLEYYYTRSGDYAVRHPRFGYIITLDKCVMKTPTTGYELCHVL